MSFSGYLTVGEINDLVPAARAAVRSARLIPHEAGSTSGLDPLRRRGRLQR